MSVECKWFYNFHHSTPSVINPTVKPSKSSETHFRFEINAEIWFQGNLDICMLNVSITSPHFNLLNQHKNPKNPYFSTKKLPTSGLLSTHFRFEVNSESWYIWHFFISDMSVECNWSHRFTHPHFNLLNQNVIPEKSILPVFF